MDIWNVDKLALFLLFFLPGFISMKVYDLIVSGESRDFSRSMLDAVCYSTLNFAALSGLITIILTGDFYHKHFFLYWLSVFVIMVVVPAFWPAAFLKLTTWHPVGKYFVHPIRKPWDYVFRKRTRFWIIVHLKNGQKIGGFFGPESFASSNPADEQIYLEEVWALDEEGRFEHQIERSRGIIVMKDEIRAVEFFRVE
jgi:hypothetical protein